MGLVRAARIFSNVVSPPIMFAILAFALAWRQLPFWTGLAWATLYGFWISLAPFLLVAYLLYTGRVSDLHMSRPGERQLPYLAAVVGAAITLGLMALLDGPTLLKCLTIFSLVDLGILGLITKFWLISIHAASITSSALIIIIVFGAEIGFWILPLVLLVSLVRLFLRRHNLAQVVAGMMLGLVAVMGLQSLGCFMS